MTISRLHARCRGVLYGALWVIVFGIWGPRAHAQESGLKPETLRVVFREESFMGVNANDAAAAFKILAQTVGRRRGYEVSPQVSVVATDAEFVAALRSRAFDLAVVDPWLFLEQRLADVVRADFVAEESGGTSKRFQLVVRDDAGCTNLAGLQGKRLVALKQAHADLGRRWLESRMAHAGLPGPESFFSLIEGANKPAGVVLPVFFGKRDVALVDDNSFQVMAELNPQVGRVLIPVMGSEPLCNVLVGTRTGPWESEEYRSAILASMAELDQHVAGRQVLTLFKIKALKAPREGQLDTVQSLLGARRGDVVADVREGRKP